MSLDPVAFVQQKIDRLRKSVKKMKIESASPEVRHDIVMLLGSLEELEDAIHRPGVTT